MIISHKHRQVTCLCVTFKWVWVGGEGCWCSCQILFLKRKNHAVPSLLLSGIASVIKIEVIVLQGAVQCMYEIVAV